MMLSENLKALRKQKGLSQEDLAAQLHVVRQTVSKWEKGLSVPDAGMLLRLAEILEVPVSRLLGEAVESEAGQNEAAEALARIAEQLAVKNRRAKRVWKIVAGIVLAVVIFYIFLIVWNVVGFMSFPSKS